MISGLSNKYACELIAEMPEITAVMPSFMYPQTFPFFVGKPLVVVDSGAHTLQDWGYAGKYVEDYVEKYKQKIIEYSGKFHYWVELDIDQDTRVNTEWTDKVYEDLSKVGNIIRVWHKTRGIDTLKRYLKELPYFGISAIDKLPKELLRKTAILAYQNGNRLHGFGCLRMDYLTEIPFYSVDASSPVTRLLIYGKYIDKNGKTKQITAKNRQELDWENLHLQESERTKYNSSTIPVLRQRLKHQLNIYIQMQEKVNKLWQRKGVHW
jgi:hypothetical protein